MDDFGSDLRIIRLGSCLSPGRMRKVKERLESLRHPELKPDPESRGVERVEWIEWGFVRDVRPWKEISG